MKAGRVIFFAVVAMLLIIIVAQYREAPLGSLHGTYSSGREPGTKFVYDAAFDFQGDGTYFIKSEDEFDFGTYEDLGNHTYRLTPGEMTKLITLTKDGFTFYSEIQDAPIEMKRELDTPVWVGSDQYDHPKIPKEFRDLAPELFSENRTE